MAAPNVLRLLRRPSRLHRPDRLLRRPLCRHRRRRHCRMHVASASRASSDRHAFPTLRDYRTLQCAWCWVALIAPSHRHRCRRTHLKWRQRRRRRKSHGNCCVASASRASASSASVRSLRDAIPTILPDLQDYRTLKSALVSVALTAPSHRNRCRRTLLKWHQRRRRRHKCAQLVRMTTVHTPRPRAATQRGRNSASTARS